MDKKIINIAQKLTEIGLLVDPMRKETEKRVGAAVTWLPSKGAPQLVMTRNLIMMLQEYPDLFIKYTGHSLEKACRLNERPNDKFSRASEDLSLGRYTGAARGDNGDIASFSGFSSDVDEVLSYLLATLVSKPRLNKLGVMRESKIHFQDSPNLKFAEVLAQFMASY